MNNTWPATLLASRESAWSAERRPSASLHAFTWSTRAFAIAAAPATIEKKTCCAAPAHCIGGVSNSHWRRARLCIAASLTGIARRSPPGGAACLGDRAGTPCASDSRERSRAKSHCGRTSSATAENALRAAQGADAPATRASGWPDVTPPDAAIESTPSASPRRRTPPRCRDAPPARWRDRLRGRCGARAAPRAG